MSEVAVMAELARSAGCGRSSDRRTGCYSHDTRGTRSWHTSRTSYLPEDRERAPPRAVDHAGLSSARHLATSDDVRGPDLRILRPIAAGRAVQLAGSAAQAGHLAAAEHRRGIAVHHPPPVPPAPALPLP